MIPTGPTGPTGAGAGAAPTLLLGGRTSSAGRDVLVVGSYPPVATAGAAVTVEAVRDLWAEGAHPHVVAPRASAAPLTVPVTGLLAGRRLTNLRKITGATDLVLCAERNLPIPTGGPALLLPIVQRLTVKRLVEALADFDHVTLVACGDPGAPPEVWARLVFAADVVIDRRHAVGRPGVTTLGPAETTGSDRARSAARYLALRLFGRHTPEVRRVVAAGARLARNARAARSGG